LGYANPLRGFANHEHVRYHAGAGKGPFLGPT
jgi:hypothetical protein